MGQQRLTITNAQGEKSLIHVGRRCVDENPLRAAETSRTKSIHFAFDTSLVDTDYVRTSSLEIGLHWHRFVGSSCACTLL